MTTDIITIIRRYTTSNGRHGVVYERNGRRCATFVPTRTKRRAVRSAAFVPMRRRQHEVVFNPYNADELGHLLGATPSGLNLARRYMQRAREAFDGMVRIETKNVRGWLARIHGEDDQYGLDREFIQMDRGDTRHAWRVEDLGPGVYEAQSNESATRAQRVLFRINADLTIDQIDAIDLRAAA